MSKLAEQIISSYERHAADFDHDRASGPWIEKPWHDFHSGNADTSDRARFGLCIGRPDCSTPRV
jgi:hypothetical protein